MQGMARMTKTSTKTLYSWYGDKQGLFKALVTRNAGEVKALLEQELSARRDALGIPDRLGPKLLTLLLEDRVIAPDRAAAADDSGELGPALAEAGRGSVTPLILEVLARVKSADQLSFERRDKVAAL
jgi:AcrR family transcriptional regulator